MQTALFTVQDLSQGYAQIFDGGLFLHSTVFQTNIGASYGFIARSVLSTVCKGRAMEVHVCLDKYVTNSIKESERKLRGAIHCQYTITGPDQKMRQNGQNFLGNGNFKDELGKFLLHEWGKEHYRNIFGGKTVIVSFGGDCYQYIPDDRQQVISVTKPAHLQGDHEEADTLIAFHAANVIAGQIIVRASDTDVLVILIGAIGSQRPEVRSLANIILDCGMGNTRRFINVSNIAEVLEECQSGLPRALPGFHAFTGCDFASAFYRKGKAKPSDITKKDATRKFVEMFISMGDITVDVDTDVVSEFVCLMYAQHKTRDVNEARYLKLLEMTGKVYQDNPLANIKRVDCALLPPSRPTLKMKIRRSQYVTAIWSQATEASPGSSLIPSDYGLNNKDNILQPAWYEGPAVPSSLFKTTNADSMEGDSDSDETIITGSDDMDLDKENPDELDELIESDDEPWSEDSDSDHEDDRE